MPQPPWRSGEIGHGEIRVFTTLGDVVNVAARLEGLCKNFSREAVISHDVCAVAGVPAESLSEREAWCEDAQHHCTSTRLSTWTRSLVCDLRQVIECAGCPNMPLPRPPRRSPGALPLGMIYYFTIFGSCDVARIATRRRHAGTAISATWLPVSRSRSTAISTSALRRKPVNPCSV